MPKDKPSKSEPTGHTGYLRDGQIDDVAFWDEFFGPDEVAAGDNPLAAFDGMSEEELGRLDLAVGMGQRWAGHVKQAQERAALDRTVGLGTEAGLQTPPTLDLYRLNVWSTLFGVQPPDALLSDWHRLEREARLDGTASEDSPVFQAPHGDRLQAWVYDKQGFLMTPPTQGTEAEVQAVIAAGGRELARGMSTAPSRGWWRRWSSSSRGHTTRELARSGAAPTQRTWGRSRICGDCGCRWPSGTRQATSMARSSTWR